MGNIESWDSAGFPSDFDMGTAVDIYKKIKSSLPLLGVVLLAQQICAAQDDLPFDVFGDAISNQQIHRHLESQAKELISSQADDAVEQFCAQLKAVKSTSEIELGSLVNKGRVAKGGLYSHMVKSSLYLGEQYDCGRCDKIHAAFSGGVVVSEDGLALTNYHVLKARDQSKTEAFMAMAYDGECFAIDEIVAANKDADVALVRLKANGRKFHAAPIALSRPKPMDTVRIVSNPHGQFFVLTEGAVSRYSQGKGQQAVLEITADFGAGSSGSGVFNDRGEVVGLVSRIYPVFGSVKTSAGKAAPTKSFVEMVLKRCVSLQGIHGCFDSQAGSD